MIIGLAPMKLLQHYISIYWRATTKVLAELEGVTAGKLSPEEKPI
jgi:hypothetical protein